MASTTKLMTAQLALRNLRLDRRVTAPDYQATSLESLMGLKAGERVTVLNLLYGLLIVSGNDAAVALADAVSGSVPRFVEHMNREAARLGLRHTHYANPIGLDERGNYSTARDLARLAIHLRGNPTFARIVDTARAEVEGAHPRLLVSHNDLLAEVPWVNGVKTGYTLDADFVLVGSGTQNRVTLVSVLLGAPSLELLRYGFSLYHPEVAVRRGERVGSARLVGNADAPPVPLLAGRTLRVMARDDQHVLVPEPRLKLRDDSVERGERVGRMTVAVGSEAGGQVPLLAGSTVNPPAEENAVDWLPWVLVAAGGIVILTIAVARRRGGGGPGTTRGRRQRL